MTHAIDHLAAGQNVPLSIAPPLTAFEADSAGHPPPFLLPSVTICRGSDQSNLTEGLYNIIVPLCMCRGPLVAGITTAPAEDADSRTDAPSPGPHRRRPGRRRYPPLPAGYPPVIPVTPRLVSLHFEPFVVFIQPNPTPEVPLRQALVEEHALTEDGSTALLIITVDTLDQLQAELVRDTHIFAITNAHCFKHLAHHANTWFTQGKQVYAAFPHTAQASRGYRQDLQLLSLRDKKQCHVVERPL